MFGSPPKGRDSYLQRCRALATELEIADVATFEGRAENIRDAYEAGSIVALSSVSEGFPYSVIEAMTCGRTCVATDVGGVTEAVGDTGLVVPPRSPARMAQAFLTLLRDSELRHRLGAAARTRALERFTVDGAISTFDEIYSFLGGGRPAPIAVHEPDADDESGELLPWEAAKMTVRSLSTPQGPRPRQAGNGAGRLAVADVAEDSKPRSLEELCEQFVVVCESAVDPLEISSALEFAGLSDQAARKRYGASDVFALAEEMFRRVPRRLGRARGTTRPMAVQQGPARPARPAVWVADDLLLAATGLLAGSHVLIVLIVALLTSWALSQGLAYLGYLRLGRAEPAQAARLLLAGEAAGIAGVALALAVTSLAVHAHITALIFGLGLGAYMRRCHGADGAGCRAAAAGRDRARSAWLSHVPDPGPTTAARIRGLGRPGRHATTGPGASRGARKPRCWAFR